MPKEKLTLSVDEEVVKKAKKLGINISEITEKVLKGFTFAPTGAEKSHIRAKYKELFDTMLPLLREYHTSVEVASQDVTTPEEQAKGVHYDVPIDLFTTGELGVAELEETIPFEEISLHEFYPPKKILSGFIDAITRGSERMKEHLKELEMAKRIVEAVAKSMGKAPTKRGK